MSRWLTKSLTLICIGIIAVQLSGCGNSGIRNPLKGRPKVTLGPLPEPKTQAQADVLWDKHPTKGGSYYSKIEPEVTDRIIYQASHLGAITALDRATGAKLWKVHTHVPVSSGPVLVNETLFVGTKDARVLAISAHNGKVLWQQMVSSEVLSPPQSNGSVVLVNSIDGKMMALDFASGKKLWTYERSVPALTLRGGSSPTIIDDQVLGGFANGKLVALELKNGAMSWERTISVPRGRSELHRLVDIHATPIVVGNQVYVASYNGDLSAINLKSGQVQWERHVSTYRDLALDDVALYITDKEHQVWAINRENGTTLWKQDALAARVITGPAVTDQYVVVGDYGGYMHWLDKQTGLHLGSQSVGKKIVQTPASMGNTVYITQENGKLTALALPRGDV